MYEYTPYLAAYVVIPCQNAVIHRIYKALINPNDAACVVSYPLRTNAFLCLLLCSGLYLCSEMFNHACNPNCIKLVVSRSQGSAVSEVRAVR